MNTNIFGSSSVTSSAPNPLRSDSSKMIASVSFAPQKALYATGEQLQINTVLNEKFKNTKITYTLLETRNNHDWYSVAEWSGLGPQPKTYTLTKNGLCSLQINLKGPSGEKDAAWIGQFEVGKVKFIETLSWQPVEKIFKQGEAIAVLSESIPKDDSTYEFQIQVLKSSPGASWKVGLPWQSSLPQYTFKESGVFALQIDICKSADKNNIQSIWLGQFTVE